MEKKWQGRWAKARVFEADIDSSKKKFFITVPYPYVNLRPHVGAAFTFLRGDVYARFKRMQGFNVLLPQGFHATGEPILGSIERLRKGDEVQINTFKSAGATDKDIKDFVKKGPVFVAKYWMKRWIEDLKAIGYSADWRRTFITTTITPTYSRFVEWQYNTLKRRGYVTQGTHPVVWCPHCSSPTGDHDRLEGEGESPIEYIIIKFRLETGEIIPCGTLRPETVYGVTNIWANPDVVYVGVKVDGESWIVSKSAAEKMKDQLKNVEFIEEISGKELIGRFAENPVTKEKIIVLPAAFVDAEAVTGIVMSVPAHAPYDWIGLNDLQKDLKQLEEYGLDQTVVKNLKPVSLIAVEGFGEYPAVEICKSMGIQSQKEREKLDKATETLYKKEFHTGVLKGNTLYAGRKIADVKEELTKKFVEANAAGIMWECTAKVVCRCMTKCYVKILENQWFLKFSDAEWKEKVKECIKQMRFCPEAVRLQFENTVDWLKDKACTRKTGLGTPLPWDRSWIVETLSDSTIYMAYYTISRLINEKKVDAKRLTDEVFNYIFFGEGDVKAVAKRAKTSERILAGMRDEFNYFYPVDLRTSGKDLVQNHLTFYLFHHTAIWNDTKYWPEAIGVNGYVNFRGEKMSKSKGNVIFMRNMVEKVGADLMRINMAASNEELNDADWRDESIAGYKAKLRFLFGLVKNLKKARRSSMLAIDSYLAGKMQQHIKNATGCYEEMKFRSASQHSLFNAVNDIKWYIERVGGLKRCNRKVLLGAVSAVVKMITPLTPHVCEEMWSRIGKGFVATAEWPRYDEDTIDKEAMELEGILMKTVDDLRNVLKIVGKKKNAYLYVVTDKELEHLEDGKDFIKKQLGFKKVSVFKVSNAKKYDPQNKAAKAKYGKPGIFLE